MGKATRWLKSLFGLKKEKEQPSSGDRKWYCPGHSGRDSVALCHNPATIPPNLSPAEAAWIRSCYTEETEKEQNKHAIAVAAATAAAADAAVAAAQAAVAVVRLTSHGRGTMFGGGGRERFAAVKIQNVFRGYLARKALRALKGLVKLQALVRGYLVRKQAAATLYSMQALIRAQSTVRSQKIRSRINSNNNNNNNSRFNSEFRARKSTERFDESKSEHQHTASFHSRRLSAASFDTFNNNGESPKIVEVDNGRPKSSRSRRRNNSTSDFGDDPFYQTISSPLPCQIPATNRLSTIPDCQHRRNFQDPDWGLTGDECKFSTAHSTPRFRNSSSPNPSVPAPVTPAKSVCIDSFFRGYQFSNCHPNYMSNTQSFKAKLRSYSAPKQRPESEMTTPSMAKNRVTLTEMMESTRSSLSGVRMQRSCSHVQEAISFKNAVMGKLDRSSDCVREDEPEREQRHYLPRRW